MDVGPGSEAMPLYTVAWPTIADEILRILEGGTKSAGPLFDEEEGKERGRKEKKKRGERRRRKEGRGK